MAARTVMLTVDVEEDEHLPRVLEVLTRAMAGLILEGMEVRVSAFQDEDAG